MSKVVAIPFDFNYDNGTPTHFSVGDVLPRDLEHDAYALAHTTNPPKVAPKEGTPEAALAAAQRKQRALAAAAVADEAADREAEEKAKAAEVARLRAAVAGAVETQEERAAAQVRTMTYQMPQDRDEAAAAAKPAATPDAAPVPITSVPKPLSDASLERARAEATQAAKRKRA